jgi:hypothetical protein
MESGLWFKIRHLFFPLSEALREMNDDIHDRFGRALERVMNGCISDGRIHGGNGTEGKFLQIGFIGVLVRFWGTARVALFPLCAGMR